ncbi:hypothetical protein K2173_006755 [Erythroxylum novogranatense]|uniref:Uncharacterized protein n=1 Tax=Erythroxylum novogranatense TaxID=1862640 RepID=A0AAV8SXP0_9ROSI|nr:hypothetical protein K2173_006755 [Erythroxylum novogranatense]
MSPPGSACDGNVASSSFSAPPSSCSSSALSPFSTSRSLWLLGRHRKKDTLLYGEREEEEGLRRCEEGLYRCDQKAGEEGSKVGLLQRYLEDQLRLVRSIYEFGDDDDEVHKFDCDDDQGTDTQIALLLD